MLEDELKKVIDGIDPSLKHIYTYPDSLLYVCKVERAGQPNILKLFDSRAMPDCRDSLSFGREHIENEHQALETLSGVYGVPALVQVYDTGRFKAVLREFIEGRKCEELCVAREEIGAKLHVLYTAMMLKGVIYLDPTPENILITKENWPFIVDFGYVAFRSKLNANLRQITQKLAFDNLDKFLKKDANL